MNQGIAFDDLILSLQPSCSIDIHGAPRSPTWTVLAQTANKDDTSITLAEEVDWKVGEEIVIASTDFQPFDDTERMQSERRVITGRYLACQSHLSSCPQILSEDNHHHSTLHSLILFSDPILPL